MEPLPYDNDTSDTSLLRSLGANIVDQEQFEKDLVTQLERHVQEQEQAQAAALNAESSDTLNEDGSNASRILEVVGVEEESSSATVDDRDRRNANAVIDVEDGECSPDLEESSSSAGGGAGASLITPRAAETEHEKRVRLGEETPFGSSIPDAPGPGIGASLPRQKKDSFQEFNRYLLNQLDLQKKKTTDEQSGRRRRQSDDGKSKSKTRGKGKGKVGPGRKSVLNMDVMFPKKKKKKEQFGLAVSENPSDARRKPGKTLAETNSFYLNYDEDSDYIPTESSADSDDPKPSTSSSSAAKSSSKRKRKTLKKSVRDKSSDEEFSEYESDVERPSKRLRKEADDGDLKYYRKRIEQWKQNETRFSGSGDFHTFEGGFKIPLHLWESLYTYQKIGVKWLWELHQQRTGGILGDEMGLGKTIQVINFLTGLACSDTLFRFSEYRGLGPVLLVTPATVMHQWVKEFHTWWPPFRVAILHDSGSFSGSKAGLIHSVQEARGVLITSYSGLVNNQNEILRHNWHYAILDEGHKIRNPDAQITLVVKQVKTPHRLILSGSPLQNNLKELWSLFDFIYPGKLGVLPTFMDEFAVPITHGGYSNATQVQVAVAYKCAKALRDMINPYLLRRMKSDVQDHINLPEKSEQVLFCKMTEDQKELYKSYISSKEINSIIQGRFNLFVGLINMRKICNHPHLFDGGPKIIKANPRFQQNIPKVKSGLDLDLDPNSAIDLNDEGSDIELDPTESFGHWSKCGKMIVVETLLKLWHAQGHKVLLFTQSRQMLCILENFVRQCKYSYLRLDGSTTISSRQPLITRFNEDTNIFIFILTTRVGGLGVNLTAANRVILYDPDWNPSTDIQARERAWRIGQLRQVTIYRLILSGTIEEKMYHRQVFKQFLTNRVLKDPKQKRFFKSNDLLELFTFNEGTKGTESEAIFAGTGSSCKPKKSKNKESKKGPRERPSGKFRDVPFLVKQSKAKLAPEDAETKNTNENEEAGAGASTSSSTTTAQQKSEQQDEYVLKKLFRKSGVEAALRHDKIVDTDEADYMIVEKEAEHVAKKAVAALKQSREQCWSAESGHANWTGHQGEVRPAPSPAKPALRFGKKKATATNSTSTATVTSSSTVKKAKIRNKSGDGDKYFTGKPLLDESESYKKASSVGTESLSSLDLLAIIRSRKDTMGISNSASTEIGAEIDVSGSDIKPEHLELLRDIREFIAFQAMVDGQATTDELIAKFGEKLPPGQSPLFKQMLSQLCTLRRVEGRGMWRLKPEFR